MKRALVVLILLFGACLDARVIELTKANFSQVAESQIPVIIDVKASWCGQCKMMQPVMEEASQKYQGRVLFAAIDIDSQNELANSYDITLLPTILFIRAGERVPTMKNVGAMSKKDFEARIEEFLRTYEPIRNVERKR
ncbi:MAG: thioredoxin domain-containing protein [Chlamydiales bacterium]